MSFLQHFEATCPKLYILSSPCHFQCENLPTCPDVQLPLDSRGGKNIPRDLVTRNFLNLNEFWEFVKMCETSPKVNNGKFLKALVSPVADTGHTWQKQNLWEIKNKLEVQWCWKTNKRKHQQGPSKQTLRANREKNIIVRWNAVEKRWKNRGGHSETCFQVRLGFWQLDVKITCFPTMEMWKENLTKSTIGYFPIGCEH